MNEEMILAVFRYVLVAVVVWFVWEAIKIFRKANHEEKSKSVVKNDHENQDSQKDKS